jgi:hypothetical protein
MFEFENAQTVYSVPKLAEKILAYVSDIINLFLKITLYDRHTDFNGQV